MVHETLLLIFWRMSKVGVKQDVQNVPLVHVKQLVEHVLHMGELMTGLLR